MIRRIFTSIAPLWDMWCLAYYRAALRQMDPTHRDVPEVVLKLAEIETRSAA